MSGPEETEPHPAAEAPAPSGEPAEREPARPAEEPTRPAVEVAELPGEPAEGELAWPAEEPAGEPAEPAEPADDVVEAEPEQSDEIAMADSDLPDLSSDADLEAALESLLLVVDSPAEEELLATAVDAPAARVAEALRRMSAAYTEAGRGIDLRHVGGGWRFYTRDRFAPFVEKLLLDGQRSRLTRAALETLAVIAYRQPATRQRVAAVRGVNVDGVIRTLLARGLIEETGTDSDTGGILYRTTELFLERVGLSSVDDLPPLAPLLPEVDSIDDV